MYSYNPGYIRPSSDLRRCPVHVVRQLSTQELILEYCLVIVTVGFFVIISLLFGMLKGRLNMASNELDSSFFR